MTLNNHFYRFSYIHEDIVVFMVFVWVAIGLIQIKTHHILLWLSQNIECLRFIYHTSYI
jgi:hypothetical protein